MITEKLIKKLMVIIYYQRERESLQSFDIDFKDLCVNACYITGGVLEHVQ